MKRRPKLVITGAAGFTGRHACRYFEKKGYEVIGITRMHCADLNITKQMQCNLTKKDEVDEVIRQVHPDYILHLAAQNHVGNSWMDPVLTVETNVLSTLYLVEAIRKINPDCKIIIAGSVLQFDPQNFQTLPHPYSLSKTLQIMIAQAWEALYKVNIIIAKPSNLIGPGISNGICSILAKKIVEFEENKTEGILHVSNLNASRDFLDVRDAVRGYDVLLKRGETGEQYEIASGKALTIGEVIHYLKLNSKAEFEVQAESDEPGDFFRGNPEKIVQLGWKRQISFEESLMDILDFYRKIQNPV